MKQFLIAAALGLVSTAAVAGEAYTIDTTHAQVVFHYNHLGYSTTFGMFSDITGTIDFDAANPAASSVEASFPVTTLATGNAERDAHFQTGDFFGAEAAPAVTFVSTGIEVTGENAAQITGDLTLNGITKSVVLDTVLTQMGDHPMAGKPWLGFFATTTLVRSEWDMGMYAPYVGDNVMVEISLEAMKAE